MNPSDNSIPDALTGVLQDAVSQIKNTPAPVPAIRSLVDRIEAWPEPLRLQQRRQRRQWIAYSLAASVVFCLVWLGWPADSWGQVVKAMNQKTWIRMTGSFGETTGVHWISLPRGVMAWNHGNAVFHDAKLKVVYRYDVATKTIYRLPENEDSRKSFDDTQRLFTSILQNQAQIDGALQQRTEIIQQTKREVVHLGRKVQEYELQCRSKDRLDLVYTMIIQADPATHLAQQLIVKNIHPTSDQEPRELSFAIDYPEQGPFDIYDLGIARTTQYVDRVPDEDLQRIASTVRHNVEAFDTYRGVVLQGNSLYALIWRKGHQWRIEFRKDQAQLPAPPKELENPTQWWWKQAQSAQWDTVEVCDGRYIYTQDGRNYLPAERNIEKHTQRSFTSMHDAQMGYAGKSLPEVIAYPPLPVGSHLHETQWVTPVKDSPPGTKQLDARLTQKMSSAAHLYQYWIDPLHSCIITRHDVGEFDAQPQQKDWRLLEQLKRSPSGIWYPEVIKGGQFVNMRVLLDFQADLPAELFTPTERKKE